MVEEIERIECVHLGETLFNIEKWWEGKLFLIMRCWDYRKDYYYDENEERTRNDLSGRHTFYESREHYDREDWDLMETCPAYRQYLRDKQKGKKEKK